MITKLIDGGDKEFSWVLGVLIATRAAYWLLEFIIGMIVWRMFDRSITVAHFVSIMRENKLPKRVYCTDDASSYFSRINSAHRSEYREWQITPAIQKVATELDTLLKTVGNQQGMIAAFRTQDAMTRALEIHSPPEDSPHLVSPLVRHWLHSNATEAEIQILPNSSPELAKRILAEEPFETLTDLYQFLRNHGLDRMQASLFLNGASAASEAWNQERI